jgi:glycine C-acetyltransferase
VLVATLGKAFGVNGGYVTCQARRSSPTCGKPRHSYIYSNPITPAEAAAALAALDILESDGRLGAARDRLRQLQPLNCDPACNSWALKLCPGEHPIVPVFIRDTAKTAALVAHLFDHNILATGLNYPVVPQGDQEIRLQVSAGHTERDLDYLLEVLGCFNN